MCCALQVLGRPRLCRQVCCPVDGEPVRGRQCHSAGWSPAPLCIFACWLSLSSPKEWHMQLQGCYVCAFCGVDQRNAILALPPSPNHHHRCRPHQPHTAHRGQGLYISQPSPYPTHMPTARAAARTTSSLPRRSLSPPAPPSCSSPVRSRPTPQALRLHA